MIAMDMGWIGTVIYTPSLSFDELLTADKLDTIENNNIEEF